MTLPSRPRLRRAEAAEYLLEHHGLPVAAKTLAKYATVGGGPKFEKFGHVPLYPTALLDEWAAAKLGLPVASTSELPGRRRQFAGDQAKG